VRVFVIDEVDAFFEQDRNFIELEKLKNNVLSKNKNKV
jgi:hypothetical protein